jgi:hypothetical protein
MNRVSMFILAQLALSLAASGCRPPDAVPVPTRMKRTTESSNQVVEIRPTSERDDGSVTKRNVSSCQSPSGAVLERCDFNIPLECTKVEGKDYCSQYYNSEQEGRMWGPF